MRSLAFTVLGAVCAYALWSAIVAVAVWNPTGYATHPVLGRIYRPGVYVHGIEGYSVSRINSIGLRGPEIGPKRPGVPRILVLGDSLTEGLQVPLSKTFAARVGDKLAEAGIDVTSVDAGRSGASPADYITLAGWYRQVMKPDVTIVQLSDQDFDDDVENRERRVYIERAGDGFSLRSNPEFVSADSMLSRFPQLAPVRNVPLLSLAAQNIQKARAVTDGVSEEYVANEPLIDWVVAELAKRYPHLVILYLPRTDYLECVADEVPTETALRAAAKRHGVVFVDARVPFNREFTQEHIAPLGFANTAPGSGHLNETGHEVVATELAPVVERALRR